MMDEQTTEVNEEITTAEGDKIILSDYLMSPFKQLILLDIMDPDTLFDRLISILLRDHN